MSDYISREEAIEKLAQYMISVTKQLNMTALPYAVYESRARSILKDIPGIQIETIPDGINGGDAEVNETKSPYMQQSRHDDGRIEVVLCRYCKHYFVEGETTRFGWCGYWNKPTDEVRYCYDGERGE